MTYDESAHNTILDYVVKVKTLDENDRIVQYAGTNYSVTGKKKNTINAGGSTARARSKMLTGWTGLDTP